MPPTSLTAARRLELLEPPAGHVRMVLDTDTYNEIDDQFALVYALLSPERMTCEAIYAAPFHNQRSSGPEDGMLRSYAEIGRVLERLGRVPDGLVHPGTKAWLPALDQPVRSAATDDLIARARAGGAGPLYVVAIGAITNIASALLAAPDIAERIVVVWLGGQPIGWHLPLVRLFAPAQVGPQPAAGQQFFDVINAFEALTVKIGQLQFDLLVR